MGGAPGITFALVDATPYRLRYLCTVVGGAQPVVLPNAAGATPDLRTDADAATPGSARNPLLEVVSTPVTNQAEARRVMLGEQGLPAASRKLRAYCRMQPRRAAGVAFVNWIVDANEGAAAGDPGSAGFPVLVVDVSDVGQVGALAYLDIFAAHTHDR